jgi:hypothetical protein
MNQIEFKNKCNEFLDNSFLDVHGVNPSMSAFDQSHVVRLLTRMSVGAATAFWSFLELKDYWTIRKSIRKKI